MRISERQENWKFVNSFIGSIENELPSTLSTLNRNVSLWIHPSNLLENGLLILTVKLWAIYKSLLPK